MTNFDNNTIEINYLADCPEYINILAGWLYNEFGRYHHNDTIKNRVRRLENCCNKFFLPITFVAAYQNRPIGTASLLNQNMETHPELSPWLASVYTLPNFRKKGVASLLIKNVIKKASELNFKQIFLFTDKSVYYSKFGWKTVLNEKYYQESVSLMKLEVP